ncbi:MAG: CDP-alcohol phosphatidyltransferase family protein [Candidatus Bipolaricaulia bacterium]
MGIYQLKPAFRKRLRPLLKRLRGVHPDWLTGAALAVSLIAGALIYASRYPGFLFLLLLVPPLLFVRLALNALDGMLATETGTARPQGEILNELFDRLADVAILLGAVFSDHSIRWLGLLAIVAVLLVSYAGILGKAAGASRQYGGPLGKADRMVYLMVACAAQFALSASGRETVLIFDARSSVFDLVWIWFLLGAVWTVLQRSFDAWKELGNDG